MVAAMKRGDLSTRARAALALGLAVLLVGCAQTPPERESSERLRAPDRRNAQLWRETAMNRQWQNRRFSELVAAMGEPARVMNIPGGGNPPGFAAVFGHDPETGCIDAFALMPASDPIIRDYYCR